MKNLLALTASALACAAAAPAFATIMVTSQAPFPQNPPENVLLNANVAGATVFGATNQTHTGVQFTTTTDTLSATSNGQASISSLDAALNALTISLTNPTLGFTSFEFNLDSNVTAPLTLVFTDQFGDHQVGTQSFTVGANGSNFIDAVASGGELIKTVSVTGANLSSVGQIRLGGVSSVLATVPEPASWALMIMGFGGAGAALRSRRRRGLPA